MKNGEYKRNWADLPPELISSILLRLRIVEILNNAQKVCRSWRRVCQDPSMWTKIEMRIPKNFVVWKYMFRHVVDLDAMCRHAVDLSCGGLLEINVENFGSDSLLTYIADRASNLRRLGAVNCGRITSFGILKAVVKLPLLEELELTFSFSGDDLKAVGKSCPNLKTLMIRQLKPNLRGYLDLDCDDEIALAIAETMPGLRHLQLLRNGLSDAGLNSILDNCPKLEHLDIRQCFNVNLVGDWEKQCYDRIKVLRHPDDSIHEYDAVNSDTKDEVHGYDDVNSDTEDEEEEEGYDYSCEEGYDYSYDSDEYVSDMAGDVHYHSYSYYD